MAIRYVPKITGELRAHILTMPEEIYQASGMVVLGKRIKSVVFSTDIAIIRNCNADAVLAVYPFTPQPAISHPIISASDIPVFCGVGGGTTTGLRTVRLAEDAEGQGALGVVVNAPLPNDTVRMIADVVDIPIVATVLNMQTDIDARLKAGVSILNISAADQTPEVVRHIRRQYPEVPIIATGGPTADSILRTVDAGANTISYTPPSTKILFGSMMERYRKAGY